MANPNGRPTKQEHEKKKHMTLSVLPADQESIKALAAYYKVTVSDLFVMLVEQRSQDIIREREKIKRKAEREAKKKKAEAKVKEEAQIKATAAEKDDQLDGQLGFANTDMEIREE